MTPLPFFRVLFVDGTKEVICERCFDLEHRSGTRTAYKGAISQWVSRTEATPGLRCDACKKRLGPIEAVTA